MSVFGNLGQFGAIGGGPPDNSPRKKDEEKPQEEAAKGNQEQEGQEKEVTKSQAAAPEVKPEEVEQVATGEPPHGQSERRETPLAPPSDEASRGWHGGGMSLFGAEENTPSTPPHTHHTGALWVVLIVLWVAFIGALTYSYYALRSENISIAQLPGMFHSIDTLGSRMGDAEAKVRSLTADWSQMSAHLATLDGKVNSTLQYAHRQTRDLETRLHSEMDQRNQAVDSRLNQIEQNQNADRASVAQLNQKLETEVAALQAELSNARDESARSLVNVNEEVGQQRANLRDLNQKLQREKVSFEATRNSPAQLAPGVALTVLRTNVKNQRFRGYVTLAANGQKLWLDNLGVQESLDLFPNDASHPYSLVITQINAHGVVGYLLMPAGV